MRYGFGASCRGTSPIGLQEAIWREILHMVNDGVATTGELDESIIYGPGLRWAAMGTNMIYHLAGGESGMRHMLAQFGPALKWPWTKLEAPELTVSLIDKMVEGTQAQAAGRSIRELERLRDDYLVAIQQVLRQYDIGAGATLRKLEGAALRRLRQGDGTLRGESGTGAAALRDGGTARMGGSHNTHMSDFEYVRLFGDAMDAPLPAGGRGRSLSPGRPRFFSRSRARCVTWGRRGWASGCTATTQILAVDDKRVHVFSPLAQERRRQRDRHG